MDQKKGHILIAGNNELILKAIEFQLIQEHYTVQGVSDTALIADILINEPVNLLLLSLSFPEVADGSFFETFSSINYKRVPLILLADYGDEKLILELLKKQAFDFIYLPVNIPELLFRVGKRINLTKQ